MRTWCSIAASEIGRSRMMLSSRWWLGGGAAVTAAALFSFSLCCGEEWLEAGQARERVCLDVEVAPARPADDGRGQDVKADCRASTQVHSTTLQVSCNRELVCEAGNDTTDPVVCDEREFASSTGDVFKMCLCPNGAPTSPIQECLIMLKLSITFWYVGCTTPPCPGAGESCQIQDPPVTWQYCSCRR